MGDNEIGDNKLKTSPNAPILISDGSNFRLVSQIDVQNAACNQNKEKAAVYVIHW